MKWLTEKTPWRPVKITFAVTLVLMALMIFFLAIGQPQKVFDALAFVGLVATVLGWLFIIRKEYWPAFLTAVLYVFCFPHIRLGVLGFVCLVPLLAAVLKTGDTRKAMKLAWVAGTLGNIGKLYWLVYTISYFSPIPLPAATLVLLLLSSTLGLFWALNLGTVHWAVKKGGLPLVLVFPAAWVFWDWFLTWFLGGFPWELLGCAAFHVPLLKQTFDLVGEHGLGWLLAFGNVVFYWLWLYFRKQKAFPKISTVVLAVLVVAGMIYGAVRMHQIDKLAEQGKSITVGLLQGNVDQNIKWKPQHRYRIMDEYADQAQTVADQGAELVIFPETAIAQRQDRWEPLHRRIARYGHVSDRYVLAGAPTKARRKNRDDPRGRYIRHNSVVLISPDGDDVAWYDKNRLVPFGEYIPKKHWLEKIAGLFGVDKINGTLNFEPSGRYTLLPYPSAPFSVFICYESVYPSTVRRLANLGAKFLVTVTNDAWFGKTSAPYQHWDQVAMRAIENRRYVARSANTGITGIIDPNGRTIMASNIYVKATMIGTVKTLDITTIYAKIGDVAAYLATLLYIGSLLLLLGRRLIVRKEKAK